MRYTGKTNTYMYSTCNAYIIFTGKVYDSLELNGKGLEHAVVLKLLEGLEDRGHHVYLDNRLAPHLSVCTWCECLVCTWCECVCAHVLC